MHLRLLLITVGLAIGLQPWACQADLVAHWTGDSTAADATANGHDGSVSGATYTSGVFGNAFSFDGVDDQITVAANADLEPIEFSISMWVRAGLENHIRLLADSTHGSGSSGWAMQINAANNIGFAFGNGSSYPEVITASLLGDGNFHHYVATLDGTNMRMYVDSVAVGILAYSGTPLPSGGNIQIGNTSTISNRAFEGALDDIRIYNEALTQSQVTSLFNAVSVPEPGSIGLLTLLGLMNLRRRRKI